MMGTDRLQLAFPCIGWMGSSSFITLVNQHEDPLQNGFFWEMLWPSFLQAYTYSDLELKSNRGWEEDNGHAMGITWTDDNTCVTFSMKIQPWPCKKKLVDLQLPLSLAEENCCS